MKPGHVFIDGFLFTICSFISMFCYSFKNLFQKYGFASSLHVCDFLDHIFYMCIHSTNAYLLFKIMNNTAVNIQFSSQRVCCQTAIFKTKKKVFKCTKTSQSLFMLTHDSLVCLSFLYHSQGFYLLFKLLWQKEVSNCYVCSFH